MDEEAITDALGTFLRRGIEVALDGEDPDRFCEWIRDELPRTSLLPMDMVDPATRTAITTQVGRRLWNAIPLPGHGFRPRPLPEPAPQDRCPCGAVANYRRCCGREIGMELPQFEVEELLPTVFDVLPAAQRRALAGDATLPLSWLTMLAATEAEAGDPTFAIECLRPLFANAPEPPTAAHADALNVLAESCLVSDREAELRPLLERLAGASQRSPVRVQARIRLAELLAGGPEVARARALVDQVSREDRHAPGLAYAELAVLLCEGRIEAAERHAQRALERLSADPNGAFEAERIEELLDRFDALDDDDDEEGAGGATP